MSAEVSEIIGEIQQASEEAGFKTAHILEVGGEDSITSHSIGREAGTIGSMLTIVALMKMGEIEGLDFNRFFDTLARLEVESGVRAVLEESWAKAPAESKRPKGMPIL